MSVEQSFEDLQSLTPEELLIRLYGDYVHGISENLWPWETARWNELVFCILVSIGEPQVLAARIRNLTNVLANLGLIELSDLAKLKQSENTNSQLITIDTLLKKVGFTPDKSRSAIKAICEAASGIEENYGGKVQKYFRKYGSYMLDQIDEDFGFTQFDAAPQAIAIWLQNTLNMPVPASNPLADKVCEKLDVKYQEMVEAADSKDINVALLDDALRAYWEGTLKGGETIL